MLLLLHDISKRESNKNMLLTLLKNMFAYLWSAIAEKYSCDHLFYLFETMVLNFFETYSNKIPRNRLYFPDKDSYLLTQRMIFLKAHRTGLPI